MAKKWKTISKERERVLLFQAVLTGDVDLAWQLVEANMRFIYKMAHKIARDMEVDDLASIGAMSLFNSIMNYDLSRPYQSRILSFAGIGIYRAMTKAQQKDGVVVRPAMANDEQRKQTVTLSPELGTAGLAEDYSSGAIDDLDRADIHEKLTRGMRLLTPRERLIIRRRYDGATLKEIGEEVGLSRERVRKCQELALEKLRDHFHDELQEEPSLPYTQEELDELRKLVEMGESQDPMDRINSRLEMPRFIDRVGKDKCDEMFEILIEEAEE